MHSRERKYATWQRKYVAKIKQNCFTARKMVSPIQSGWLGEACMQGLWWFGPKLSHLDRAGHNPNQYPVTGCNCSSAFCLCCECTNAVLKQLRDKRKIETTSQVHLKKTYECLAMPAQKGRVGKQTVPNAVPPPRIPVRERSRNHCQQKRNRRVFFLSECCSPELAESSV